MRPASRKLARHATAIALTAAVLGASAPARAYVQRRTDSGLGFSWRNTSCLPIVVYPMGFQDMPPDEVLVAAGGAASEWSQGRNACTYLTLSVSMSDDPGPLVVPAQPAAIVFREDKWCRFLDDGTCSKAPVDLMAYSFRTLMLTGLSVNLRTGQISRASVEVNAVDGQWADLVRHPEGQGPEVNDLQNALTHELGHFIGLDHNCDDGSVPDPRDNLGNPAPFCESALPASITEATMYYKSPPGELIKRTLSDDDIQAVCDIYPVAQDPGPCGPPDETLAARPVGCACEAGGAGMPGGGALGAVAALALVVARRRRGVTSP